MVLSRDRPRFPAGLVSMRLCLYRTSRVYRGVLLVFRFGGLLVCNEQPLPTPEMRPPSLSLSSLVSLCSFVLPQRPCTAHPPSHVYTAIGSGFGVALVWRRRRMQEGQTRAGGGLEGLTWFGRRRRQGERRGAGARMSGRREGTQLSRRGGPPSPRPSCSDCGVLPGAGCCMCCRVGVCLVCVMQCISRTLTHTYTSPESDDACLGGMRGEQPLVSSF